MCERVPELQENHNNRTEALLWAHRLNEHWQRENFKNRQQQRHRPFSYAQQNKHINTKLKNSFYLKLFCHFLLSDTL